MAYELTSRHPPELGISRYLRPFHLRAFIKLANQRKGAGGDVAIMKPTIVLLREVASARSGDKGDISYISAWVYDPRDYGDVKTSLTAHSLLGMTVEVGR